MRNKPNVIPIVLFLLVIMLLVFCQKQKTEWKGTIEEIDGVTVVKNPKDPMYGEEIFSIEKEFTIGKTEDQEEYMLSLPRSIAVDDDGSIYVLDLKESHIKVFDNKGVYKKTIGRRGQGPGDLQGPLGIQITGQNEIMVNNLTSSHLVYFNLKGDFLRMESMTGIPRSILKMDSCGDFICSFLKTVQPLKVVLEKYNSRQERLFSIIEIEPDYSKVYSPLAKSIIFDVTKDNDIIWAITNKYEIMITNAEGNLTHKIIKAYDPVEISEEEKQILLQQTPLRSGVKFPKHFPPLLDTFISVDEDGRIFIGTYERGKDGVSYYFDVFDAEGKYITKVPIRHKMRTPIIWKNDKLYTIEEDEEGYQVVRRYKVNWKF